MGALQRRDANIWLAQIDTEHECLFRLLRDLEVAHQRQNADKEVLVDMMTRLLQFAGEHFRAEEAAMAQTGYPGLMDHRAAHEDMIQRLSLLAFEFERERGIPLQPMIDVVNYWIGVHIAGDDRRFQVFLTTGRTPDTFPGLPPLRAA